MKALVTGCAGFIGSHIVDRLLSEGWEVLGVDDMRNGSYNNNSLHDKFEFLQWDVCALQAVDLKGVTHICHQAATGSVPKSIAQPAGTVDNNIMGFQKILDLAREMQIKRVVYASSSSIYGTGDYVPLSPYAMTKQVNEMQAGQYHRHYGLEVIGLRYFNVYGPRQRSDGDYAAVIPKWVDKIRRGEQIEIYGDGRQSRDFTYINDVVDANALALMTHQPGAFGRAYDIGIGSSITLNYLAQRIGQTLNKDVKLIHGPGRKGDISFSRAKTHDLEEDFGWLPQYNLDSGLTEWLSHRPSETYACSHVT